MKRTGFIFVLVLAAALNAVAQNALPEPWKHQDIGAVQTPGKAEWSEGVFTVEGTLDLWGLADGCHLVWQPCHGDTEMITRVVSMDNPGKVAHAKASLCIRDSLDAGSRCVSLCVTASDGAQFLYREQKDGKTAKVPAESADAEKAIPKGKFPCWLKLVRRGKEFSGYESVDGSNWRLLGKANLDLGADTVIGLASSSHKPDVLTKVVFDQVKVGAKPQQ
jgi:hypothetical protein